MVVSEQFLRFELALCSGLECFEIDGLYILCVFLTQLKDIIRLILPVSHFSVKRLIHACVWHCLSNACGRLIKTEITYSQKQTDNFANSEANT